MKILILKPSSLGDVVQALPVLRLLKLHWPESAVYWWISSELASLLEDDPDLAGIYRFERRRWLSPWHWGEMARSIRQMRRQRFDWVVDLQGLARSGLFSWLARGQMSIGVDDPREGAGAFYDVRVPRPSEETHAVDWYLEVISRLGVPLRRDFVWMPPREKAAASLEQRWGGRLKERWVLLNPGARWANKRWPAEAYRELARRILAWRPDIHLAILGGRTERETGAAIAEVNPSRCLNLAGETSLPELVEWIRLSQLLVTNDTGPMHIAAALQRQIVAIFGPTDPARTGPYGQLESVMRLALPCVPCMKPHCANPRPLECLTAISVESVFAQVEVLLGT